MPASDDTVRTGRRTDAFGIDLTRYDLVLAVIPVAFVASILAGHLLALPTRTALVAASFVGALAVADALFVHPPRGRSDR